MFQLLLNHHQEDKYKRIYKSIQSIYNGNNKEQQKIKAITNTISVATITSIQKDVHTLLSNVTVYLYYMFPHTYLPHDGLVETRTGWRCGNVNNMMFNN